VCVCVCMCMRERVRVRVRVLASVCACVCQETSLRQSIKVYMQYNTLTHWQIASATSAGVRTHDDDELVDFPSTL